MINRHNLRIKAFKNLYAYENCRQVNRQLALDNLRKRFSPDLNAEVPADKQVLDEQKVKAEQLWQALQNGSSDQPAPEADEEVRNAVSDAFTFIENQNSGDARRLTEDLFKDIDSIRKHQVSLLQLLRDLAFVNQKMVDEREGISTLIGKKELLSLNLANNRVINKLGESAQLADELKRFKINWFQDQDQLRDWFKGLLHKDDMFRSYQQNPAPTYDDDYNIAEHILRGIIFKNDVVETYFEEKDINWPENKAIVRSLVLKSIKTLKQQDDTLDLAEISYSWEDDSDYLRSLFKSTINDSDYLENLITDNLQNWDLSRVALTDKVLLKLAITEMIHFHSIPVKVTINEFIEISKTYSTPKSKSFVNGLLDVISEKLTKEGTIRKSGRGLIDNK
jgi:N utilization substance protein B